MGQDGKRFICKGIIGLVMLLAWIPQTIESGEKFKKRTVLILTGGHDFDRDAFFRMFKSFGNVSYEERVHPLSEIAYTSEWCKRFDAVVFYDMHQEISTEQKSAFRRMANRGMGLVFLHHSLASYQNWPDFEKIIGGKYLLEAENRGGVTVPGSLYRHDVEMRVRIADPRHAVTQGLEEFTLQDEIYGGYLTQPGIHPLITTDHAESVPVIGWTHRYGKARIVYLQPGHDHHAFEHPSYRQLVRQAIEWVSR
ncbi:MAG TPA: ThuA domain-containing protein [bacterium]|nr:ThuA domain-containing protein [bacterium]HPN33896.1 ThuA domain-containing protein [bacterium]